METGKDERGLRREPSERFGTKTHKRNSGDKVKKKRRKRSTKQVGNSNRRKSAFKEEKTRGRDGERM